MAVLNLNSNVAKKLIDTGSTLVFLTLEKTMTPHFNVTGVKQ